MPHHEQGPDPRPHHDRDGHNGPPPPHHHSYRSRNAILICLAVLLTFAFIFWLTDPVGFRERMEAAAKKEQEYAKNRPVPTPIMTDPGTTPPPIGATPSAVPEKTEKPAATKAPEKEPAETGALEVYIIDVGQADSIFLRSPKGKTMLIDSGEAQNYDDVCAFLKEQGVTKLDVVVATHPHNDHIGSMYKIINTYEIGKFYMPAVTHTTATYEKMLDALADKNITPRIAYAKPNAKIAWGDGSVTARIVSPFEGVEYEMNDWSIVLHVSFKDTSILLTADAETYAESVMLANLTAADLDADVLKLGHHGSSTSSTEAFLDAVSPEIAVISVGKGNDYDHPHEETLKRLKKRDVQVYRTDKNGTISLILDGEEITVSTKRKK